METIACPSDLEDHLGYWMRRVSDHVSSRFEQVLGARQVSVAEWVMVRTLLSQGEATPAELAISLGLTRGAISKIIDKLEEKRWLTSRDLIEDGRVRRVSLTSRGRHIVPKLAALADANDEAMYGCLSTAERNALRRMLVKLARCHRITQVPLH